MIQQADKEFIVAFTKEMSKLGYGFDGKIGDGFCWGKYMIIYAKTGVKNKDVLARIYIREDGIVLRLYFNRIDEHRDNIRAMGGNSLKKNMFCTLLIVIVLFIFTTASLAVESPPGAVPSETIITTVIPLKYDPIESVNGDLFITNKDLFGYTSKPMKNLYNFAGDLLMEGMQDISFSGNWIIVRKGGKLGVYSHELVNLVPCLYSRVVMTDETHCEVVDGTKYVKPGTWYGNRYRYDLTTGLITEELGYGMEAFPSWSLVSLEKRLADAGGLAGISLMKTGGKLNKYGSEAGAAYKAYNGFGQLLLDFTPYCGIGCNNLTFGSGGRLFFGSVEDGNDSHGVLNYAFSGRGRLIAKQRGARFEGVYGGDYIAYGNASLYGVGAPFLLNWDGETVIAEGVYDNYRVNFMDSDTWTSVSDNSSHIIVSKDGLYGVISPSKYVPKPSSWAQAEVADAVQKGLVPEDVKVWWKDSCTRLEFCRMLALTIQGITGSSVAESSAGTTAVGFSDCSEPDVVAVAALGITKGIGNDRFAPYSFITREQAAVMLARTAAILKIQAAGMEIAYADIAQFPEWAVAEIEAVSSILCGTDGIPLMQGSGNNLFSHKRYITVEQSAAALYRLTEAVR